MRKPGNKKRKTPNAKNGKPQVHATQQFASMVGDANQNALKPYIMSLMEQSTMRLQRYLDERMASTVLRVQVLEDVIVEELGISRDKIRDRFWDIDDNKSGFTKADRAAAEGDTVRLYLDFDDGTGESKTNNALVENLGVGPFAGNKKLGEEYEAKLLGLSAGQSTEIEEEFEGKQVKIKLTVARVSEKNEKEEADSSTEPSGPVTE